jgi:hypothetical protein
MVTIASIDKLEEIQVKSSQDLGKPEPAANIKRSNLSRLKRAV